MDQTQRYKRGLSALSAFAAAPAGKPAGSSLDNFGMLCTMGMMIVVSVVGVALLANVVINLFTWKRLAKKYPPDG